MRPWYLLNVLAVRDRPCWRKRPWHKYRVSSCSHWRKVWMHFSVCIYSQFKLKAKQIIEKFEPHLLPSSVPIANAIFSQKSNRKKIKYKILDDAPFGAVCVASGADKISKIEFCNYYFFQLTCRVTLVPLCTIFYILLRWCV